MSIGFAYVLRCASAAAGRASAISVVLRCIWPCLLDGRMRRVVAPGAARPRSRSWCGPPSREGTRAPCRRAGTRPTSRLGGSEFGCDQALATRLALERLDETRKHRLPRILPRRLLGVATQAARTLGRRGQLLAPLDDLVRIQRLQHDRVAARHRVVLAGATRIHDAARGHRLES